MKVISSIVTYNADLQRLEQNIKAILPQVGEIVLVDNGSNNLDCVISLTNSYPNIHIIREGVNKGIAKALNDAASYAYDKGFEWIITLDQDSVSPSNLVSTYEKYTNVNRVGMISCKIIDRNFGELSYNQSDHKPIEEVSTCITSASMLNLKAWKEVGGFDENMFIDSVDFDICYSLREHGYKVLRTNETSLLHEVGHSEIRKWMGKERQIFHHSPIRYYYMARNGLLLGKKHHFLPRAIYRSLRGFIIMLLFDDHRQAKAKMMLRGYWHFIIGKYGKLQ